MKGLKENYFVICLLLLSFARAQSIIVTKSNASELVLNARNIGRALMQCINQNQKVECVKIKVMHILEEALHDNSTWHYGDFVLIEKNEMDNHTMRWSNYKQQQQQKKKQRSVGDRIGEKLLQLIQTRSLRLKIPNRIDLSNLQTLGAGFSDALDDLNDDINSVVTATTDDDAGEGAGDGGDDGDVGDGAQPADEGRKKKDKDKTLAMMGGMTVVAMMAQMFLGKVILIAGASFVIAKVALLISLLTSIKSKTGGGHGSDHVIVTGGSGHSGWHRSMPYDEPDILQDDEPDEPATHHTQSDHDPPLHSEYESPSHSDHSPASGGGGLHDFSYYNHKYPEHNGDEDFERRAGFLKT